MHFLMMLQFTMRWESLFTARNLALERQDFGVHKYMSTELVPLVEIFFTVLIVAFVSFLFVVKSGHMVLQACIGDKGLRTCLHNTLVRFFPTVDQLMSGELVAGAKVLITVVARERFQPCVLTKVSLKLP